MRTKCTPGGRYGRMLIVATVLCVAVPTLAPVAKATFPGKNGRVAFSYGGHFPSGCGAPVIMTINPNDKAIRTLTDCGDLADPIELAPDWAPKGRRILFTRDYGSAARIEVMKADGSREHEVPLRRLPPGTPQRSDAYVSDASYSPDGKHFVYTRYFARNGDNARSELWVAAIDGSGDRRLQRAGRVPHWSPNGRLIAYTSPEVPGDSAASDIGTWVINPRTGRRVRIARRPVQLLDWSPDSRRLLYLGPNRLLVMRANGSGRRRLPSIPLVAYLGDASFSPNGRRIAVSGTRRYRDGEQQHAIWTMTVGGTQRRQIYAGVRVIDLDWGPPSGLSWQARSNR